MTSHRPSWKTRARKLEILCMAARRQRDAAEQERDAALWRLHQAEKRIAVLEKELAQGGPKQGRLAA